MRRNRRDWRIENLISIAERYGVQVRRPGGSHVIFSFGALGEISVPDHRPIKPVYIKAFVALVDAMRGQKE